jgi:hypothetical protein
MDHPSQPGGSTTKGCFTSYPTGFAGRVQRYRADQLPERESMTVISFIGYIKKSER